MLVEIISLDLGQLELDFFFLLLYQIKYILKRAIKSVPIS